jgi:hypothetical protein
VEWLADPVDADALVLAAGGAGEMTVAFSADTCPPSKRIRSFDVALSGRTDEKPVLTHGWVSEGPCRDGLTATPWVAVQSTDADAGASDAPTADPSPDVTLSTGLTIADDAVRSQVFGGTPLVAVDDDAHRMAVAVAGSSTCPSEVQAWHLDGDELVVEASTPQAHGDSICTSDLVVSTSTFDLPFTLADDATVVVRIGGQDIDALVQRGVQVVG